MVKGNNKTQKDNIILAIDGATKTGYAIYKNGRIIVSGTMKFRKSVREQTYGEWVQKMIVEYDVTQIVAEDIYREHSRMLDNAFYALAKLHGVLMYVNGINGLPDVSFLNPLKVKNYMIPTIRKLHTREEDKQRMINRVAHLGYTLESEKADDEADAIGILLTYLNIHDLPINHPSK